MGRKWTDRERKIQAFRCRRAKPWKRATGPRSAAGKDRAKKNALKHGLRSANGIELHRLLALQKEFVKTAMRETL